jgi:type IV secretory pathway VirB3-like protein
VPTISLVLVLVLAVMLLYVMRLYIMAAPIAVLYAIMRYMTSKDPWMLDMMLDFIQQKDVFIP